MLQTIVLATMMPAVLAGIIVLVATPPPRLEKLQDGWRGRADRWAGAVAIAAGYVAGHFSVFGFTSFPPVDSTHWLPYLAVAACVLGLVEPRRCGHDEQSAKPGKMVVQRWAPRIIMVGLLLGLSLRPLVAHSWSAPVAAAWLGGAAVVTLVLWYAMDKVAANASGPSVTAALGLVFVGSSVVLLLSGSASLGLLAGAMAAILAALTILVFRGRTGLLSPAAISVITILMAGLWLHGYFFAEIPTPAAVMLLLAPFALWAASKDWKRIRSDTAAVVMRFAAVLVPLAAAILVAWRASPADDYYY